MKKVLEVFLFLVCTLMFNLFCYSQNQKVVDSLMLKLETEVSDKNKVDIYVQIASQYRQSDSALTFKYSDKAVELANKIDYVEGSIDALYPRARFNSDKRHYGESKLHYSKMLDLASKNNYLKGRAIALQGLGFVNFFQGNYDIALDYFSQSIPAYQKAQEKKGLATSYNLSGIINDKQGYADIALENYFKALEINKEINNEEGVATNFSNIGIIYKNQGDYAKALDFQLEAQKLNKSLGRKRGLASNYSNIGLIYFEKEDYKTAKEYYLKSLVVKQELNDQRGIAYTYDNIGQACLKLGDFEKARENYMNSMELFEKIGLHGDKVYPLLYLGELYEQLNELIKSRAYYSSSLELAQEIELPIVVKEAAQGLASVEKKMGHYKKAYEAHVLYKKMADSLNNEGNIKKITQLTAEYEFKKERDSLEMARQQELVLFEEKSKRKRNRNFAIGICVFLIFLTGLIIYIFLNKIRRTKELDSLRNHISRDLHDEIGTTLSSLALFGTVAMNSLKDNPKKASKMLNLINSNTTASVEAMNDIIWAINSEKDAISNLIHKMQSFISDLSDTEVTDINISYDQEITDVKLDMVQRRNVYLIFKEALNNAIKYAQASSISINIGTVKNLLKIQIQDNGVGFDPLNAMEKKNMFGGNGLKNMKKRANELKGTIQINSQIEKGTEIILTFNPKKRPHPADFNNVSSNRDS